MTSNLFLDDVALSVLESVGTPFAENVKALIGRGDWDGLAQLWVDPSQYSDAASYAMDAQALAMFSKIEPDEQRRKQTKAKALADFLDAEKHCFKTNLRLEKYVNNGPFEASDVRIMDHIESIRRRIKLALGRLPDDLVQCGFGKGATYDDRGKEASLFHKITSLPTVYENARCLLPWFYQSAWGRSLVAEQPNRSDPCIVRGNRFTSVLKNVKTDRGICVESSVSLFLQKGFGKIIRRRLRTIGIDLDKGQREHRRLAYRSSKTGEDATIDLSQASDMQAYLLVKLLLPGDWFELADTLRADFTEVETGAKRGWYKQEKFSSMGNGFTFELMTLLLWAICQEACDEDARVMVYGDDIIVPAHSAQSVLSILRFFGHKPNARKSFTTGPFRESCGGDYYGGRVVRPYFRKTLPSEPQHWISLANGLSRFSEQQGFDSVLSGPFRKAWLQCLDKLPSNIRALRGPESLGDLVIHDNDVTRWGLRESRERRSTWDATLGKHVVDCGPWPDQWQIRVYAPVAVKWPLARLSPEAQLAVVLYGVGPDGYSPRGEIQGYVTKWVSLAY